MDKIPPGPVLWAGCSLSASPHMLDAPNPNLHGDRLTPLHLCCAGEPRTRLSIPAGVSSGLRRGKVSPPLTWWQHSSWYSSGSCWTFLGRLLACVLLGVQQDPWVLFCKAHQSHSTYWCLGLFLPKVQDFAFLFFELHEVCVPPFPHPASVPLHGSRAIWWINHSLHLGAVCECAEEALHPITQDITEGVEWLWPCINSGACCLWLVSSWMSRCCSSQPLEPSSVTFRCTLLSIFHQFACTFAMGEGVESLAKNQDTQHLLSPYLQSFSLVISS